MIRNALDYLLNWLQVKLNHKRCRALAARVETLAAKYPDQKKTKPDVVIYE